MTATVCRKILFAAALLLGACSLCAGPCLADPGQAGLLGHWPLDGDASPKPSAVAVPAAEPPGLQWTDGPVGKALSLDGRDDFLPLGDLGRHPAVTIAFWFKAQQVEKADDWQGLVTSDAWEAGVLHVSLRGGVLQVHLHLGGNERAQLKSGPLENGRWYHAAVVADTQRGQMQLLLNGRPEDAVDISTFDGPIQLAAQVIGRESGRRCFRGAIDDVWIYGRSLNAAQIAAKCPNAAPLPGRDWRNIRTGYPIPDEGYCDQPYVVVTRDGNWLCTLTTGPGREGDRGQHVVATISADQGRSWSKLIDIEPSGKREASWVMPLVVPSGRVYAFYTYNGENIHTLGGKPIRADTLGWYVFKYSDDNGRSWSARRFRLPMRVTAVDRRNQFGGRVQCFWGIGKPIVAGRSVFFAFSKVGKLVVDKSEGWFYRSDNILSEPDPEKISWQLLPDGDRGLKAPGFGDVHAEQNIVALSDGSLYCMYRTVTGYPFHAYSRDGGHTWTRPEPATYTPGGRPMKTPRACPRIWRTAGGKFLFWFHNHSGKDFAGRNPAWIAGGVERDGYIHWSQPEILLYDPNPDVRISYPDLIEQDGQYWITETQKTVARVHRIDPTLLEGLWNQGRVRRVTREGLLIDWTPGDDRGQVIRLAGPLVPQQSGGLSLDFWVRFDQLAPGQIIADSGDRNGRGLVVQTTPSGTIGIRLSDGRTQAAWDCDPGLLAAGRLHHVVVTVDDGPRIISFVVDGQLCDGGRARQYGWGRYDRDLGDISGTGRLRIGPSLAGSLKRLRLYGRPLRTSEAVAHFRAGP